MKITLFGATGALGSECLKQSLAAGHELTVLVRSASKLPAQLRDKITIIEGDALNFDDVKRSLPAGTKIVLFAIGVDKGSPQDLCTRVTRHIFDCMRDSTIDRFIWCGGGSTFTEQDQITFGARFVRFFAATFMSKRHIDKEHQYQYLQKHRDLNWIGVRPLQMKEGPHKKSYRLGFDTFSGMSSISFADCADSMIKMLADDTWLGKAPIVQY